MGKKSDSGYILLHRSMTEWEWYDDAYVLKVFLHLLFAVNWKDGRWHGQTISRGETITSVRKIADACCISINTARKCLKKLESTGEITIFTTNRYTKIRVNKYAKYQNPIGSLYHDMTQSVTQSVIQSPPPVYHDMTQSVIQSVIQSPPPVYHDMTQSVIQSVHTIEEGKKGRNINKKEGKNITPFSDVKRKPQAQANLDAMRERIKNGNADWSGVTERNE